VPGAAQQVEGMSCYFESPCSDIAEELTERLAVNCTSRTDGAAARLLHQYGEGTEIELPETRTCSGMPARQGWPVAPDFRRDSSSS
jgi:hypothetical protein